MTIKRIPLFGSIESRDYASFLTGVTTSSAIQFDQGGTDVQYDVIVDNANQRKIGYFYPRENFAITTAGIASAAPGSAIHAWQGSGNLICSAFGTGSSTLFLGTSGATGVTGIINFITEALIPPTGYLLMTITGNKGYFINNTGGSITLFQDTYFPPNQTPALTLTGPLLQLDGYIFAMATNGQVWNSELNTISDVSAPYNDTWLSGAYLQCNKRPDAGIGLAFYGNGLVAFGLASTEFLYNAGNASPNSPLSSQANFLTLGCANQYAYTNIGNTVAFFSTNEGYAIYLLEGQQAKKISTPPIDRILAGILTSNVRLHRFTSHNKLFLLVTMNTSFGLAYDIAGGTWQLWNFADNPITQTEIIPSTASDQLQTVYVGTAAKYFATTTTGRTGQFLTGKFDADNKKRKFLSRISAIGALTGTGTANVSISWSDNDYQTFSTARSVNINANEKALLTRCGSFYSRAFKVSVTNDNTGGIARIAALELDFDQGDD